MVLCIHAVLTLVIKPTLSDGYRIPFRGNIIKVPLNKVVAVAKDLLRFLKFTITSLASMFSCICLWIPLNSLQNQYISTASYLTS